MASAVPTHRRALASRLPALVATLAVVSAVLLATSACGPAPAPHAGRPPNVLLVCLDTVRADHLGLYGYEVRSTTPTLDSLAARGLVFDQAVAASGWTKPSVPSFITGTFPAIHGVYEGSARRDGALTTDVLGDSAITLAERFRDAGYATAAFIRNAQLRTGLGFEQGFDTYVDQAGDAAHIRQAALDWLDARADDERPWFLYLHVLDVHWPYDVPDDAAARFASPEMLALVRDDDWRATRDAINDGDLPLDAADREQLLALYDGALRFADDQLGLVLAGLAERDPDHEPVVAVVSDHGEEFLEHGRLGHGHGLWQNLTHAVFLLAGPGVPARHVATPVGLPDLHPTLLAAAGLSADATAAHWSVDRLATPDRELPLFSEHKGADHYIQSLRMGDVKLVRRFTPPEGEDEPAEVRRLRHGGRWEAELRAGPGPRMASQLKPRDESDDDPVELKGWLEVGDDGPSLAGLSIAWSDELDLGGTLVSVADLTAGRAMKVEGDLDGERFVAHKAKGYGPDESLDVEIRGGVTRLVVDADGSGTVWLGGIPVRFDDNTQWKDLGDAHWKPLLERDTVAQLLELGGDGAVGAGYGLETRLYDLAADPGEERPLIVVEGRTADVGGELSHLAERLDAFGRQLAAGRQWAAQPGQALADDDVAALRALGYVR